MKRFLFMLVCLVPLLSFGDSAPLIPVQSGCVKPIKNNDVMLKSEVVNIYMYREYYEVEVNYNFVNTGEEQKVLMGFPNHSYPGIYCKMIENFKAYDSTAQIVSWSLAAWDSEQKLEDFRNGKILHDEYFENYYSFYECFQVLFAKGETKKIRNTYTQEYVPIYLDTLLKAKYILTTGALWKDDIDTIVVNIIPKGISPQYLEKRTAYFDGMTDDYGNPLPYVRYNGIKFQPGNFVFADNAYHFLFTNTEPDFNIELSMAQKFLKWVETTSELSTEGLISYKAMNMFDNDPATAWAEGRMGGINDTITIGFSPEIHNVSGTSVIKKIGIINGLACDSNYFYANNRVKKIKLLYEYYSPEKKVYTESPATTIDKVALNIINQRQILQKEIILKDAMEMQYIEFPPFTFMNQVIVIIEDIYKGSKYDDTCISEIQFFPE